MAITVPCSQSTEAFIDQRIKIIGNTIVIALYINLDTWPTLPPPRQQPNFGNPRASNTIQENSDQFSNTPHWTEKMILGMQKISNQLAGQDSKIDELYNRHNYRRLELLKLLEAKKPDIALLSETKLNHRHVITYKDFDIIRIDRQNSKQGGGTAVIIRKAKQYNAKIYPIHIPSRTDSSTYLDICITDLQITDLINNKLSTCVYDSDHLAFTFTVKLPNRMEYIDRQQTLHRFNFKATKWDKFQHKLQSNYNTIIPDDKNLTIKEIDEYIEDINKSILTAIEEAVPKFKPHNNLYKYFNSRIKKLQKNKSNQITELHKLQTNNPSKHRKELTRLKELIKLTKAELRKEFAKSSTTYYANLLKEISHRDASSFFPKINRYLRRKNPISIGDQILNQNDPMLIGIPAEKINSFPSTYTLGIRKQQTRTQHLHTQRYQPWY
ncbi:hypothetical protein KQX54_011353 [Cotesia glomerata]|uniref:Endonuclease/exonuclease/phosphatase domain-containing protein n=1 Tax=Cotesia glomerata TaxID=32391 RepID=A0AAV7ITW7_COTGL|nr:hypothetical protein KQX54_011353 [Cotesia glomerata]